MSENSLSWGSLRRACVAVLIAICCFGVQCASAQASTGDGQSSQDQRGDRQSGDDRQSCQAFVQKFYDWYWNPFADQADMPGLRGHTVVDVLKLNPPVLDPNLLKLLKREERGGRAGSLDFDPFLNSNAPHGKYVVSKVEVSGDFCRAIIDAGHEVAALKKAGSSWLFVDFRYSYYFDNGTKRTIPDTDLIQLLTT